MKSFFRLLALCSLAFFAWTCNTESQGPDTISLTLSDSLKATLQPGDSLVVTRYDIKGSATGDTLFQDMLYHGPYTSPAQLQNLVLPPPTLLNYLIVLEVYRNGQKILKRELAFTNGKAGVSRGISVTVDTTKKTPIDTGVKVKSKATVVVNPKTLNLYAGGATGTLLAAVSPDSLSKLVTWTSSDSTLASVSSSGIVTPIKVGHVFIRARAQADTGAWDTTSVTIQPPKPTSVQVLNSSPLSLPVNDSGTILEAQVYPSGAAQDVSWSAADTGNASVDKQGRLRTRKVGQIKITATVKSDSSLHADLTLSVVQPKHVDSISVAPDSLLLFTGGAQGQLLVTMKPADTGNVAQYRSSDISVATVSSNGKVTAVAPGVVEIFVNPLGIASLLDSCKVTIRKDVPVLTAGNDRQINLGDTVIFPLRVTQGYGSIQVLKWDLNGDGIWEDSMATSKLDTAFTVTYHYTLPGTFQAAFYAKDGEGNAVNLTRRVVVGSKAPFVDIVKPGSKDTTVNVNRITLAYLVDGAQFTKLLSLNEGLNHIVISDTGKISGLVGTDTVNIRVDTKPPVVKITSPAKGFVTRNSSVTVAWTVDGAAQNSSESLVGKQDTIKIIRSGLDSVGNPGFDTVAIVRDTISPAMPVFITSVIAASPDTTNQRRPTWVWKSGGGGNHSFHLALLDSMSIVITDTIITDTIFQAKSALSDGRYTLSVSEYDLAGNVSPVAKRNVAVRTVGPMVVITSPITSGTYYTATSTVTLSGTAVGTVSISQVTYKVGSGAAIKANFTAGAWSTPSITLTEGNLVPVTVTAFDQAGNTAEAILNILLDATPPSAPAISSGPAAEINVVKGDFGWTVGSDGATGSGLNGHYRYSLNGGPWKDTTSALLTNLPLIEGTNVFAVQEQDRAMLWSVSATRSVRVDTTGPVITLTSHANPASSTSLTITLSGQVKDTGTAVAVMTVSGQQSGSGTVSITAGTWTTAALTLKSGANSLLLTAADRVGNARTLSVTVNVNVPAPVVVITNPTDSLTITRFDTITVSYTIDSGGVQTKQTKNFNLVEGVNRLVVASSGNVSGNIGRDTVKVTKDATQPNAPTLTVVSALTNTTATWNWTSNGDNAGGAGMRTPAIYRYSLNSGAWIATNFTQYQTSTEGSYTLIVQEQDKAGNWSPPSTPQTITVDKTPPSVVITGPNNNYVTSLDKVTISYKVDGAATSTPCDLGNVNGANTCIVSSTDLAKNTGTASITVYRRWNVIFVTVGGAGTKSGANWENAMDSTALADAVKNPTYAGKEYWVGSGLYTPTLTVNYNMTMYGGLDATKSPYDLSGRNLVATRLGTMYISPASGLTSLNVTVDGLVMASTGASNLGTICNFNNITLDNNGVVDFTYGMELLNNASVTATNLTVRSQIYRTGIVWVGGTFNMVDGAITGNSTTYGTAVSSYGTVTLSGVANISGNVSVNLSPYQADVAGDGNSLTIGSGVSFSCSSVLTSSGGVCK